MYTFPGNAMAEGGTENKESTERTNSERPTQLRDEVAVKEVSTQLGEAVPVQLGEAEKTGIKVFEKTDSQRSLRPVVYSGPETYLVTNLRAGKSIAVHSSPCCG